MMMCSAKKKPLILTSMIAAALAVIFVMSLQFADAAPDSDRRPGGYIHVEKDVYHVPVSKKLRKKASGSNLPSSYRSDKQSWAQGIRVKDQDWTSLCWAFSTTSAAEYSYAKESNDNDPGNTVPIKEISPGHLGYFLYNRVNDPLGNTFKDRNTIITNESWADFGGNELYAMQHLATWSGAGAEEDTPFGLVKNGEESISSGTFDGYDDDKAYKDYVTQEESIYLVSLSIDTIKKMIMEHGAVSISLAYYDMYLKSEKHAFYNKDDLVPRVNEINHAVTAIGWDDSFSRDNFWNDPGSDGALIIQNSWGYDWLSGEDGGLIYVSYKSKDILDSEVFAFDMQPADTYQYNFQYDGTADCGDATDPGNESFLTAGGTKAANVYYNNTGKTIKLESVGFTTFNDGNTDYQIDVYTGVTDDSDPTAGIHAGTANAQTTTAGCKTAELQAPVEIGAGESFSIIFSFADKNAFGIEKYRKDSEAYGGKYMIGTAPGQSFFKAAGSNTWSDMNDYGACFRIKGFANDHQESDPADIKYTVQFTDGLGNILSTQEVMMGQSAAAPAVPQREGYDFIGWDKEYSSIYRNTLVTAQWKKTEKADPVKPAEPEKQSTKDKKANPLKLKGKTVKVRYKKLRKRSQTIKRSKIIVLKIAKGKPSYKIAGVKKAKFKKYFKINKRTGKLKIKKKLKKGTYKVKVRVTAAGNAYYRPGTKMVTFKVRVK